MLFEQNLKVHFLLISRWIRQEFFEPSPLATEVEIQNLRLPVLTLTLLNEATDADV